MQGQLCLLTCAGWRDLSNHIRMSTIQSRKVEKKAKNHVTLTWKFWWKFGSTTTHLPFFSSNPKILCFPKNFSHQNEAYLMLSKRKKLRQEKQKERVGEKKKSKSQDCCTFVTFKSKNYLDILLSAHAQTSQANILHLDQKTETFTTCK